MAGAGLTAAATGFGLTGIVRELIDELGDLTQTFIEQTNAIKLIDQKTTVREYKRYTAAAKKHKAGQLKKVVTTEKQLTVTLWEVIFILFMLGMIKVVKGAEGGGLRLDWALTGSLSPLAAVASVVDMIKEKAEEGGFTEQPHIPGRSDIPSEWIQ